MSGAIKMTIFVRLCKGLTTQSYPLLGNSGIVPEKLFYSKVSPSLFKSKENKFTNIVCITKSFSV